MLKSSRGLAQRSSTLWGKAATIFRAAAMLGNHRGVKFMISRSSCSGKKNSSALVEAVFF